MAMTSLSRMSGLRPPATAFVGLGAMEASEFKMQRQQGPQPLGEEASEQPWTWRLSPISLAAALPRQRLEPSALVQAAAGYFPWQLGALAVACRVALRGSSGARGKLRGAWRRSSVARAASERSRRGRRARLAGRMAQDNGLASLLLGPNTQPTSKPAESESAANDESVDGTLVGGGFCIEEVESFWEEVDKLGKSAEDIAAQCAWLSCVQRKLGYFAALHEGASGSSAVVSQAPPLPLVLSWEGSRSEVYETSLAVTGGSNLLQRVLGCEKQAGFDKRSVTPDNDGQLLRAKVSLLRGFKDISETATDFIAGEHGLWYCGANGEARRVYLPEVTKKISGDEEDAEATERVLRAVLSHGRIGADVDEGEKAELTLPEGCQLYRFDTVGGECPVSNLPTMKRRVMQQEHVRELVLARSRYSSFTTESSQDGQALEQANSEIVTLTSGADSIRALFVPPCGSYTFVERSFSAKGYGDRFAGVQRIFVIASTWDHYIDGIALPERRCAWYGDLALDLVILESLRRSRAFTELNLDQDTTERGIEVLLPLLSDCLGNKNRFTVVPLLVGGLMQGKVEDYAKLLAPYLDDPSNMFVVSGDIHILKNQDVEDFDFPPTDDPDRWMRDLPLNLREGEIDPLYDAVELFLAVLAKSSLNEELCFELQR